MVIRRYGPKSALNRIEIVIDSVNQEISTLHEIGNSISVKGTDLEKKLAEIAVKMLDLTEELRFETARCTKEINGFNYRTESDNLPIN